MMRSEAVATQQLDDARTIVTRLDFAPGAETGWHTHGLDYVIVALTDLTMLLEHPGGDVTRTTIAAGTCYARKEGVEHNVINDGGAPMSFVEIELK